MCGTPERLTAFGARTFLVYHNNNGSESAVVKTVELNVSCIPHVAEPLTRLTVCGIVHVSVQQS
jgi:hypothetical protein